MSVPVELAQVVEKVEECGRVAVLVTASATGVPHVSSVAVTIVADQLTTPVGRSTAGNVRANPRLTLVWPDATPDYLLLLDGSGTVPDEPDAEGRFALTITVDHGILHRRADGATDRPSCVRLGET